MRPYVFISILILVNKYMNVEKYYEYCKLMNINDDTINNGTNDLFV